MSIEDAFIAALVGELAPREELVVDIGDDAAVSRSSWSIIASDAMVDGVHFNLDWLTLGDAAGRCLTANLSDLAAMGAEPGPFTLTLGIPAAYAGPRFGAEIGRGIMRCLERHDRPPAAVLSGGDVVRSPTPWLSITVTGRCEEPVVRRAEIGDLVVVFDVLGDSSGGLKALERGQRDAWPTLVERHLRPTTDLKLGRAVGRVVRGMLDLSDGLAVDAGRFRSRHALELGAAIELAALPVSDDLRRFCDANDLNPAELAVSGGEDYTLCAAVAPADMDQVRHAAESVGRTAAVVGRFRGEPGVVDAEGLRPLSAYFRHF